MTTLLPSHFVSPLTGVRILLVDDVAQERALLSHYLHRQACRVYMATDGRDALQKTLVVRPDLILMDLHMPVCDGLTACLLLKENAQTCKIPIIFLTGAVLPEERVRGLKAGAIDYITKPFDFEEIKLRLMIHLQLPRPSFSAGTAVPPSLAGSTLDQVLFMSARQHVLADLGAKIDLVTLAGQLSCNPRRLNEAFKQCVGVTLLEYQREERMKAACQLLLQTAMEVQDIAIELGFSNGANFSTAFKERHLVSPSDFRRSNSAP